MKIRVIEYGKVKLSPVFKKRVKRLIGYILRGEEHSFSEINVILTTDNRIKRINRTFLGKNRPTDVISFNLDEIGEIYISVDTARKRAKEYGFDAEYEMARYCIHGLLHIVGYDHKDKSKARLMGKKEEEYLALWEKS
ncbi:MAG: rRNA maturation RNase YbeY [bacterium]|nr:rRNA maturation RNase YbeY [bacterium]